MAPLSCVEDQKVIYQNYILEICALPLTNARDDARVAKAVGYIHRFPGMTVPDAMKLADFSKEEQQDPAKCGFAAGSRSRRPHR